MIITIAELVRDAIDMNLVGVPSGGGAIVALKSEEIQTLRCFEGMALEVDARALPLRVYLCGGSPKRLAIHPSEGGFITIPMRYFSLKSEGNTHELIIYRSDSPFLKG